MDALQGADTPLQLAEISPLSASPSTPITATPAAQIGQFFGKLGSQVRNFSEVATDRIDGVLDNVLGPGPPSRTSSPAGSFESAGEGINAVWEDIRRQVKTFQLFPAGHHAGAPALPRRPSSGARRRVEEEEEGQELVVSPRHSVSVLRREIREQQEDDFEMQLALALSLSLAEVPGTGDDGPSESAEYVEVGGNLTSGVVVPSFSDASKDLE